MLKQTRASELSERYFPCFCASLRVNQASIVDITVITPLATPTPIETFVSCVIPCDLLDERVTKGGAVNWLRTFILRVTGH